MTGSRNGEQTDQLDTGLWQSMGGLRSTANDMLKFLGAELGFYSSSLDEAMKATHQERYADDKMTMGLGWEILKRKKSGKTIYYHKGGTNGFVSFAGFNLEDQIGAVVLINGRQWFSDLGFSYWIQHILWLHQNNWYIRAEGLINALNVLNSLNALK